MKTEKLHGMFIANLVMTRSLIAVLPGPVLQVLRQKLEENAELGRSEMLTRPVSDETVQTFDDYVEAYLQMVQKEDMQRQQVEPFLRDEEKRGPM